MTKTVQVHSTHELPPRDRVAYWNDWASDAMTKLQVCPQVPEFNSKLKYIEFDGIALMEAISTPANVSHICTSVRRDSADYLIHLQRSGRTLNSQAGKSILLEQGDYTLCDSTLPCDLLLEGQNRMLVMRIPQALLRSKIAAPGALLSEHMPGQEGVSGMVSRFILSFWRQCLAGVDESAGERVAHSICDLLAASFSEKCGQPAASSSTQMLRKCRIEHYIDRRLFDAEMTPRTIADAAHISLRYLHKLFAAGEETVSQFILRRRLEECAGALTSASQRPKAVATIAFEWGFNNATYFARAFKKRYGMTPSAYRREGGLGPLEQFEPHIAIL